MRYQKTFAFAANTLPKAPSPFWRRAETEISIMWGALEASNATVVLMQEKEVPVIKVVVSADSIYQLGECCFALGLFLQMEANKGQYQFHLLPCIDCRTADDSHNSKKGK